LYIPARYFHVTGRAILPITQNQSMLRMPVMRLMPIYFAALLLLLAACRPTAPTPTAIPTLIPADVLAPDDVPDYGLVAGGYRVDVIGTVSGTTASQTAAIEYGSAVTGMRHPGTNESGNVGLAIMATLDSGGEGTLLLEFPVELGIGTHRIGANSDLNPAAVGAVFRVAGRAPFDQRVSGTLTLDFINRRSINGEVDVTLLDADGHSVTIRGAFHRVPFTPREEYTIELSGIYTQLEFQPQFSKGIQGADRFIQLRFTARRTFAEPESGMLTITARDYQSLQPGEYDVLAATSPVTVEVQLGNRIIPVQSGTVLFVRTSDTRNGVQQSIWQGAFTLSLATDSGTTTLTGLFNHFDPF
jgi:hypothetical protein